ncbi:hypothetical protein ACH5RR_034142 [Cinchona calisaya]|uniref:Uncharacterized protein n=1 Tax=Cinchona calisaya TaxID=153742 RepID=A0ABD2YBB6_9GENT
MRATYGKIGKAKNCSTTETRNMGKMIGRNSKGTDINSGITKVLSLNIGTSLEGDAVDTSTNRTTGEDEAFRSQGTLQDRQLNPITSNKKCLGEDNSNILKYSVLILREEMDRKETVLGHGKQSIKRVINKEEKASIDYDKKEEPDKYDMDLDSKLT